ncbi:TPR-like protein [Suillus ampliporus]|nr:TPR-like protein [Suillus ampliporus]
MSMADDVEQCRVALQECPRLRSFEDLANSLLYRFLQQGVLSDIVEAIGLYRVTLALRPPDHPDRFMSLNSFATSLEARFRHQAVLSDLDEAIELRRVGLAILPPGHSDSFFVLECLANALQQRVQARGVLSDLDEAITLHKVALALRPPGHFHRFVPLNNLATSLLYRFLRRGVLSDMDKAIKLYRAALAQYPPCYPHRFLYLNDLATGLLYSFEQRGFVSDLDEAIELCRAALELCPAGHPHRSVSLGSLANSLTVRFRQRGALSDIDGAIELQRAALALCPPGHSDRSSSLNNLAHSFGVRFKQRGVLSDLDEAIELHRAALALCPPGHVYRFLSLSNLANDLRSRFKRRGDLSDVDEAIELQRAGLALRPPGQDMQCTFLGNLAIYLRDRFQQCGIPSYLDEAIVLHRRALVLCPPGHSGRPCSLSKLAVSLRCKFQQCGVSSILDDAIELHRVALALRPPGHPYRFMSLDNLTITLQDRFQQHGLSSDSEEVFKLYSQLSQVSFSVSHNDIRVAKAWVALAEQLKHGSALVAYQTTLKLLDQYVAILSSSSHHFDAVREATSSLAMDAFSCCVRRGALTTAVELVEQGRAVWWTQLARFRIPLDELSASGDAGHALAEEFKQLSFRLRTVFDASTEDHSPLIRQLTMQWDNVVSRIRLLPGFSRFLLPSLFSDLQKAAEDGPVIIVNGSKHSCDALIVTSAQDPILVPLNISLAEVSELSSEFQSVTDGAGFCDHRLESKTIVSILRQLWDRVVGPIVQALKDLVNRGSRIWWCPTAEFTLLPLHAAGPYASKSRNLSYFYVSSYTPTLVALIRARQHVSRDASVQHFVAVGQGNPDGGKELRCVAAELAVVAERVAPILSFTWLADSDATVLGASDAFSRNQWLHLACHGMPNWKQPFESSFAMRDGPLTIRDIIRSRLENPEFAFLSACHTTVGDESSPDEAIHLAAAMQFSGFRSVIGSMWSVDDEVARQVVTAFYDHLVDGSGRLDCRRAAVALHNAVKTLRKKIPLEQQIVFVHIGV